MIPKTMFWTFQPPNGMAWALWANNSVRLQFEQSRAEEALHWLESMVDACRGSMVAMQQTEPEPVDTRASDTEPSPPIGASPSMYPIRDERGALLNQAEPVELQLARRSSLPPTQVVEDLSGNPRIMVPSAAPVPHMPVTAEQRAMSQRRSSIPVPADTAPIANPIGPAPQPEEAAPQSMRPPSEEVVTVFGESVPDNHG